MRMIITLDARLAFTLLMGNLFFESFSEFEEAYESTCSIWNGGRKVLPKDMVRLTLLKQQSRLNELMLYRRFITSDNWEAFYEVFVSIYGRNFVIEV